MYELMEFLKLLEALGAPNPARYLGGSCKEGKHECYWFVCSCKCHEAQMSTEQLVNG